MDSAQAPTAKIRHSRRRRGSIVGPVLLIAAGLLLLGQNFGLISASVWPTLLNLWPVLLILIGLELVLGRGGGLGAIALVLGVVAIAGAGTLASSQPWNSLPWNLGGFTPVETIALSEEVGQTRQASYSVEVASGSLSMVALPTTSASLVEGTLERDARATIQTPVIQRSGDVTRVSIVGRKPGSTSTSGDSGNLRMTLKLSPTVSTDLKVSAGAGDINLDLRDLNVTNLDVSAGVAHALVILPRAAGKTTAGVSAGIGGVEITIPQGVAAQVKTDTGIGGVTIDESRFAKVSSNLYRSRDYDTAENRVDLVLSAGIGGVDVR